MLRNRTVPKFFRLKLTDALKELLRALPIKNFVEIQGGDHIYLGKGLLKWGNRYRQSQIRVEIKKNRIVTSIQSQRGAIICPFNNAKEREAAIRKINEKLGLDWE